MESRWHYYLVSASKDDENKRNGKAVPSSCPTKGVIYLPPQNVVPLGFPQRPNRCPTTIHPQMWLLPQLQDIPATYLLPSIMPMVEVILVEEGSDSFSQRHVLRVKLSTGEHAFQPQQEPNQTSKTSKWHCQNSSKHAGTGLRAPMDKRPAGFLTFSPGRVKARSANSACSDPPALDRRR